MGVTSEVDFLVDSTDDLSVLPVEVKSGKDYWIHSALDKFLSNGEYDVKRGIVLSNEQRVYTVKGITYMPVYYSMFIVPAESDRADYIEI